LRQEQHKLIQWFYVTLCITVINCCRCARIQDTRKTVPGLRLLDKWAVQLGGGTPHRMGLYDMMMIKDNHIAAAGGLRCDAAGHMQRITQQQQQQQQEEA
jgi:nicotinate-nucleotide pyrophosphorylase